MRLLPTLMLALAFPAAAYADVQTFYLRHFDTPVTVPGGTSTSLLDEEPPSAPRPLAEEQIIPKDTTGTFAAFASRAFAADTTLLPIASVRLHLSANAKMRSCATPGATLFTADENGNLTEFGQGARVDTTVEQGSSGGTVGFGVNTVEFAIDPTTVSAGHGLALSTTLRNDCSINRRTFFAYDGVEAATRVRFQCCFTTAAKCAAKKIQFVAQAVKCLASSLSSSTLLGRPKRDDVIAKCRARLQVSFAKVEARGTCPSTGDADAMLAALDAFVADLATRLTPLGPTHKSRCQYLKVNAAMASVACLLKLEKQATQRAQFLDVDPRRSARCRDTQAAKFALAETKVDCDTTDDAATIAAKIDAFETSITSRLACPCP